LHRRVTHHCRKLTLLGGTLISQGADKVDGLFGVMLDRIGEGDA